MSVIEKKLKAARHCHSSLVDIHEKIRNVFGEGVTQEFAALYDSYLERIKALEMTGDFVDLVKLTEINQDMLDFLLRTEHSQDINLVLTQTYKTNFFSVQKKVLGLLVAARDDWHEMDKTAADEVASQHFQLFLSKIKDLEVANQNIDAICEALQFVRALLDEPRNADIYVLFIGKVKEHFKGGPKQLSFHMDLIVDEDKTRLLTRLHPAKEPLPQSPFITSFGLTHLTPALEWHELARLMRAGLSQGAVEILDKKAFLQEAKSLQIGVIILNTKIKNPIMYETDRLLHSKPPRKNVGVSEEMAKVFRTIEYIPLEAKENYDFSVETYDIDQHKFVVLQCLSAKYAKFLGSYKQGRTRTPNVVLRRTAVEPIFRFLKGRVPRVGALNEHLMEPNQWFLKAKPEPETAARGSLVDPKFLRNNIYLDVMDAFEGKLKKNPGAGNKELKEIMSDAQYVDIFNRTLHKEYFEFTYKEYFVPDSSVPLEEFYSTFLYNAAMYSRMFLKELFEKVKDCKLEANPKKVFSEILTEILQKFISNESNLYMFLGTKEWMFRLRDRE